MPIKHAIGYPLRANVLLGAATCALLAGTLVGDARAATPVSPTLTANPANAIAGARVKLSGSNFPDRTPVSIMWDTSTSGMPKPSTSTGGAFSTTVTIPKTAPLGDHTISATAGGITAKTSFQVAAATAKSASVGTDYVSTVLTDTPTAYWPLNESNGTAAGDVIGSHPGTYSAVTLGQPGLVSGSDTAAGFDGGTSIVTVGTLGGVTDFSIEGWQKLDPTVTGGNHPVFAGTGAIRLMGRAGNGGSGYYAGVTLDGTEYVLQGAISQNNASAAVHWVMVRQGTTLTVYRNGLAVESRNDLPASAATLIGDIGASAGDYYALGTLGEIAVYSQALSANRIQAHYTAGTSNSIAPPTPTPTQPPATPSPTPTSPRTGTVYWTGDFSTGDWSQWGNPQAGKSISPSGIWGNEPNTPYNGNASLAIVTSPVRHPGGHAVQLVTGNRSDIQTLRAAGAASGSFALDWAGSTSALINWNDTAATIQSKLNAMPAVSAAGGVIVDAPLADGTAPNGPLNTTTQYIMFNAAGPHAAFTISNSTLVGATPSISFGVSAPNYPHDDASIIVNTSDTHASAGQSTYYGFSMYVPSSTNGQWVDNDGAMNIFWEVQGQGNTLSMGVDTARSDGFSASNPGFYLTGDWAGSPRWVDSSPMQYDTWTDFVIRIRWSYDDSGVIEICKNGTNVYSNVSTPTLAPNQSRLYMQAMNYHQPSPNVISYYLAEHRIGDSYSAVAP